MQLQKTSTIQSAAGALLAALAKGEKGDAAVFQQQFTESIEAVASPRKSPQRRREQIEREAPSPRQRAEAAPRDAAERSPPRAVASDRSRQRDVPKAGTAADRQQIREDDSEGVGAADDRLPDATPENAEGAVSPESRPQPSGPAQASESSEAPAVQAQQGSAKAAETLIKALSVQQPSQVPVAARESEQAAGQVAINAAPEMTKRVAAQQVQAVAPAGETTDVASPEAALWVSGGPAPEEIQTGIRAKRVRTVGQETQASNLVRPQRRTEAEASAPVTEKQGDAQPAGESRPARGPGSEAQAVRAQVATVTVVSPATSRGTAEGPSSDTGALKVAATVESSRPVAGGAGRTQDVRSGANQSEQVERIARVIRASLSRGGSRVSLQLDPPDLGHLRVQMQLRGGNLSARFETQTDTARAWLEQNLGQLRDSLASGGIRLVEATVQHRAMTDDALGGQPSGPGNFLGDTSSGRQGGQHSSNVAGNRESVENERPTWADVPMQDQKLNIVA